MSNFSHKVKFIFTYYLLAQSQKTASMVNPGYKTNDNKSMYKPLHQKLYLWLTSKDLRYYLVSTVLFIIKEPEYRA